MDSSLTEDPIFRRHMLICLKDTLYHFVGAIGGSCCTNSQGEEARLTVVNAEAGTVDRRKNIHSNRSCIAFVQDDVILLKSQRKL